MFFVLMVIFLFALIALFGLKVKIILLESFAEMLFSEKEEELGKFVMIIAKDDQYILDFFLFVPSRLFKFIKSLCY